MAKKYKGEYGQSGDYLTGSFDIERYASDKKTIADAICGAVFDKTQTMFRWTGLPETIPERWLEMLLQRRGYCVVAEVHTDKGGGNLYALWGGLGGEYDAYYQPTIATIANPWLDYDSTLTIEGDQDGVLVSSDTLRRGLLPVIGKYAALLTENCISLRIADIMARATAILSASDSDTAESAREYLRQMEEGTLGVIKASTFLDNDLQVAGTQTQAHTEITDLIELEQYLKASMYNELGLLANYNMKRESLTAAETELNDDTTRPLADDMLRCRQEAAKAINAKYGTNISVEFAGAWAKDAPEETEESGAIDLGETPPEGADAPTDDAAPGEQEEEDTDTAPRDDSDGDTGEIVAEEIVEKLDDIADAIEEAESDDAPEEVNTEDKDDEKEDTDDANDRQSDD